MDELTRSEKTSVCFCIAEEVVRLENKRDKIKERVMKGEKFMFRQMEKVSLQDERDFLNKQIETLNNASKKLSCS